MKPSTDPAIVTKALHVVAGVVFKEVSVSVPGLQQDGLGTQGAEVVVQVLNLLFIEDLQVFVAKAFADQGAQRFALKFGNQVWSHCSLRKKKQPLRAALRLRKESEAAGASKHLAVYSLRFGLASKDLGHHDSTGSSLTQALLRSRAQLFPSLLIQKLNSHFLSPFSHIPSGNGLATVVTDEADAGVTYDDSRRVRIIRINSPGRQLPQNLADGWHPSLLRQNVFVNVHPTKTLLMQIPYGVWYGSQMHLASGFSSC